MIDATETRIKLSGSKPRKAKAGLPCPTCGHVNPWGKAEKMKIILCKETGKPCKSYECVHYQSISGLSVWCNINKMTFKSAQ